MKADWKRGGSNEGCLKSAEAESPKIGSSDTMLENEEIDFLISLRQENDIYIQDIEH